MCVEYKQRKVDEIQKKKKMGQKMKRKMKRKRNAPEKMIVPKS